VLIADSGSKARELLSSEPVDGILIDFPLERADGASVCRHVRTAAPAKTIPIVMVADLNDRYARARAIAAGADELTTRQAAPEALKTRLRGLSRKDRGGPEPRFEGAGAGTDAAAPSTLRRAWPDDLAGTFPLQRAMMESGIARILDPTTITRACRRVGIDVTSQAPTDAHRVLPEIRALLLLFLSHDQTDWYIRRLGSALDTRSHG
jgi:DNA-binding response OmpR family regulator